MPEPIDINECFPIGLNLELSKRGKGSKRRLALAIEVTPTYISMLASGKRYGDEALRRKIAAHFGYTYEDFLKLGRGEPITTQPATDESDYYKAPLVAGRIAAGPGRFIPEDEIKSFVWIYLPKLRERSRHRLIAVEIGRGENSMKPTLLPGDIVLIDTDEPQAASEFKDRRIYAIRTEDGACRVKRLSLDRENILIESDNRRERTEVAWTKDLKRLVVGRVVWAWRNLLEV